MSFSLARTKENALMGDMQGGTTLTPGGAANQLHLISEDFDLQAVRSSGTPPARWSTLGLAPQDVTPNAGLDENGQQRMYFTSLEGLLFETSSAPAVGDKIYGACITNDTGSALVAIMKYDQPIDLLSIHQVHVVEDVSFPVTFEEAA